MGKTASSSSNRGENEDEMDDSKGSSSKRAKNEDEGSLFLPGFRGAAHRQKPKAADRKMRPAAFHLAEAEGFEPPVPFSTTVFKTAAIDHSATPPEYV